MTHKSQPYIIAAMPAYNEERYVGTMVLKTRQYASEVIVVDDGSSDSTPEIAALAGAIVVRHSKNRGYGASIQTILAEAKRRKADALVVLDADAQHDPDDIPNMLKPVLDGYDFVIGSRELKKNHIPPYRRLGQKILLHYTNILSPKKLSDTESGFRSFSKKAIMELELKENGMAVSAETVAAAAQKGLKVTEVPISVRYSRDSSTLNPVTHGLLVLLPVLSMIVQKKALFLFGLSGVIIALLGLTVGGLTLRQFNEAGDMPMGTALISAVLLVSGVLSIFTGITIYILGKKRVAPHQTLTQ